MKVGRRNLSTFVKRIFSFENYKAIINFTNVHEKPFKSIYDEIFSGGKYPRKIKFKSPMGIYEIQVYSSADFSTFNLIFCRQDYYTPKIFKTVIDIGSNIGLSAIYWLTRNKHSKVYCYEPSTANFEKLKNNLSLFKSRSSLNKLAVSNYKGTSFLNLEKTGVYSSLNKNNINQTEKERCEVIDINFCLEEVLKKNDQIDILKIDSEGEEFKTVASIDKSFWKHIQSISVDNADVKQYIPENFFSNKVGSALRYYRKQ